MMLSAELMLHGVSLTLVTFGRMHHNLEGQAFTIFILTVAACEAGLALSLILALYQKIEVARRRVLDRAARARPAAADVGRGRERAAVRAEPPPMQFPRLTPAGAVPDIDDEHDADAGRRCRAARRRRRRWSRRSRKEVIKSVRRH